MKNLLVGIICCFKFQGTNQISAKDIKTETNRKRKQSVEEFEEDDENRDWWTKYFASIEAMIEVYNRPVSYNILKSMTCIGQGSCRSPCQKNYQI